MRSARSKLWPALCLVAIVMLSAPGAGFTQDAAPEEEPGRWMIYLGAFFPDAETQFQTSDPEEGLSPVISFEDLGLKEDAESLRLNVSYNFGQSRRHLIELQYLAVDRDGRLRLEEDIEYGGEVFPVGLDARSTVKTEDIDIHYTYMVVRNDRGGLGLSAGLHAIRLDTAVSGTLSIGGGAILQERAERVDEAFPLPLVGIRGYYDFSSRLRGSAGFKWLSVKIDDIEGGFLDANIRLEYMITRVFSAGLGWSVIDADYDRDPSETELRITKASYEYTGPELFVRFRF